VPDVMVDMCPDPHVGHWKTYPTAFGCKRISHCKNTIFSHAGARVFDLHMAVSMK